MNEEELQSMLDYYMERSRLLEKQVHHMASLLIEIIPGLGPEITEMPHVKNALAKFDELRRYLSEHRPIKKEP